MQNLVCVFAVQPDIVQSIFSYKDDDFHLFVVLSSGSGELQSLTLSGSDLAATEDTQKRRLCSTVQGSQQCAKARRVTIQHE